MDFFDKVSRTVTEAGQKTIAKTKELADTSRLNSMISEEEKLIRDQYYQLGMRYVSIHREDYEEEFAEMIRSISLAEERIKDYRKQIQVIKGMQRCANCGKEVPRGAFFCSSCGTAMPKVQEPNTVEYITCPKCGSNNRQGMRFCTSCGNSLEFIEKSEG